MTTSECSEAPPKRGVLRLKHYSLHDKFTSASRFPSLSIFKAALAVHFPLFYEFGSQLVKFHEKRYWVFIGIALNLYVNLDTVLIPPILNIHTKNELYLSIPQASFMSFSKVLPFSQCMFGTYLLLKRFLFVELDSRY